MIFDAVFIVGENLSDWQRRLIVLLLTPALFATSCCVMPCLSKNRANFDRFRFPNLNQLTNVITPFVIQHDHESNFLNLYEVQKIEN